MPVKSYKMGPGTLTIGEIGTLVDFTAQVSACKITWSKDQGDALPTLDGGSLSGDVTYSAALAATLVQDLTDDGIIDYSWNEKGTEVPFSFTPSSAEGKSVTGVVTVDPIDVGGEVGTKPTSDIEWACVGEPELGTDLG